VLSRGILSVTLPRQEQFESVIASAKTGAEWAITALYRDFAPGLLRYLRTQAPGEAEDLASEVWMNAAIGLARFEGDEAGFRYWLFSIARRRVIDFRRREQRRRMLNSLEPTSASDAVDPETQALMASERESALAHIAGLPPAQAEVVLLRVVGGLAVEEVAAIVGKKPGAVRVLQHRALKRLSRKLVRERREADVTE
jgi:RNA polymerase sigma-70 factor, ECF subfamily